MSYSASLSNKFPDIAIYLLSKFTSGPILLYYRLSMIIQIPTSASEAE